jgi:hypothetical protein
MKAFNLHLEIRTGKILQVPTEIKGDKSIALRVALHKRNKISTLAKVYNNNT